MTMAAQLQGRLPRRAHRPPGDRTSVGWATNRSTPTPPRPRRLPASLTLLLGLVDLAVVLLKSPTIGTLRRSILLYDEAQKVPWRRAKQQEDNSTW